MSRILIVSPTTETSLKGNGVSARRWRRILEELGHQVTLAQCFEDQPADLLLALHARRSAAAVERFHRTRPGLPILLALTGTDLYGDIAHDVDARRSLELATRLIVLQPSLPENYPEHLRPRTHVIFQSTTAPADLESPPATGFDICVLGHLRAVKDPFRTAEAVRLLPDSSRVRVVQLGAALEDDMAARAEAEERDNPRYSWRGEVPREEALRTLARSHLHVLSSRMEGGANALVESITLHVPSLCTRILGAIGILGDDYPGFFPVGDTRALSAAIHRAELDPEYRESLRSWGDRIRPRLHPERERKSWEDLLHLVLDHVETENP